MILSWNTFIKRSSSVENSVSDWRVITKIIDFVPSMAFIFQTNLTKFVSNNFFKLIRLLHYHTILNLLSIFVFCNNHNFLNFFCIGDLRQNKTLKQRFCRLMILLFKQIWNNYWKIIWSYLLRYHNNISLYYRSIQIFNFMNLCFLVDNFSYFHFLFQIHFSYSFSIGYYLFMGIPKMLNHVINKNHILNYAFLHIYQVIVLH